MINTTKIPFSIEEEIEFAKNFTELHKEFSPQDVSTKEAECIAFQYPYTMCKMQENDPFVGRVYEPIALFSPQPDCTVGLGYGFDEKKFDFWKSENLLDQNQIEVLSEICDYWKINSTRNKIKEQYTDEIKRWASEENYFDIPQISHSLFRMSGSQLDYGKLLKYGIDGLDELIKSKGDTPFYNALRKNLVTFTKICEKYIDEIEENIKTEKDETRKEYLQELRNVLVNISHKPASSFMEAIQLFYLWSVYAGSWNLARIDTYLGQYYADDIDNNVIDEEKALDLLCGLWNMIGIKRREYDSRVVVGGKGRKNEKACDRFAKLAINATRKLHDPIPQLSLRIYKGMDESVYNEALKAISEGCTFPMLYNDDVNIPAVQEAFNVSEEIAMRYCPFGCGEYVLEHMSVGTPSGIINLTKALESVLFHGKDPETGEVIGLDLGGLETYKTFDELYKAYTTQVETNVYALAKMEELEYIFSGKECGFLNFSMLFDDCIERGKAMLDGGIAHLGGTLESYGNVNAADSMTAIKKLVYDEKVLDSETVLNALKANFVGYEMVQKMLKDCPKYGNEDEQADRMLINVHEHICKTTQKSVETTTMDSYLIVVINNDANTVLGHWTRASADGRNSGLHLANANNPQGGADFSGVTSMLTSIAKPPINYHAGSVQNLKLTKEMFSKELISATKALLATYFENGGAQIMITVVSKGEMEDAQIHPENHKDLVVRVGGFSARFIELKSDVQNELLSRTLHG